MLRRNDLRESPLLRDGPVGTWIRIRLVRMALTTLLMVWLLTRVAGWAFEATRPHTGSAAVLAMEEISTGGEAPVPADARSTQGLRDDLFALPHARPAAEPARPRTNPVELLEKVELQGVVGGDRPRAMIRYRTTQETVTVSVGDDLGEFEVIEIGERSVVLKWRDELFELSL